jgi:hypothetical protein
MRPVGRLLLLTLLLAGAVPAVSLPEPTPEELEANRRLVERYRADPEHYARLKRDLKAFAALPPERQNRLRQLDQDLHEENTANLTRLWRVLDRYAAWLEHLPEAQRKEVENAPDARARLEVVRRLREEEWVKRLPEGKYKEVMNTPPENRPAVVAKLREAERRRRQEWQRAVSPREDPPWKRGPLRSQADLPPEVRAYLTGTLLPLLTPEEKKTLTDAEGQAPQFGQTLLKLAESHPVGLPGSVIGPMSFQDLPKPFKQQVRKLRPADRKRIEDAEGKWPDYAIAVSEVLRKNGMLPQEMGPCHPRDKDFPPVVQAFIEKELLPKLDEKEKERLRDAEGKWPDYPRLLLELARRHNLQMPGTPLPGPREFWERLRQPVG